MGGPIPEGYKMGHGLDDEARAALGDRVNATVATINPSGTINLAHVYFLFEDERLYFETASTTRKARNIADRGTISLLIDHPDIDVRAEGRARLLSGEEAQAINRRLRDKYEMGDQAHRFFTQIDDCAVEITVERWRTWRNTVLREGVRNA
jgi:general stress protein 26